MRITTHKELEVFKLSFESAMKIYYLSKRFPKEETYSLTDQIRRCSRSVCSNQAEAFRKRRYPKAFILKLNDSESEAAETHTWLDFSLKCEYMEESDYNELYSSYEKIIGMLVKMASHPENWSW